ncbi:MAG: NADH-quinone oxidoreductase subunit M [Planctomycetota bacterium]
MSLLTPLTLLPLLGAVVLLFLPAANVAAQRLWTLAVTTVVAGLGVGLWLVFDGGIATAQQVVDAPWFTLPYPGGEAVAVRYKLGADGLSLLMVGLTAILMPLVVLSSYGHIKERTKEFLVWLLVMETGMLGVFLALDLVLFYFFWEVSLVPLYFMVGIWGGTNRLYATVKFFLYTLAGSLVMLVAVIALIARAGTTDVPALVAAHGASEPAWIFLAFALAFAIKVPVVPFHTWLADAHTEAPTSGSVILAGILLKMGTYGLLRFGIQMFPATAIDWAPLFMALGALGIVYGAFLSMAQNDLKRLVACSSVSHLGFVVLGMFALTQAGLRGGVLQMVNHGLSTGLLFLLVGMIYERRHSRMIDHFGGLAATMPIFAFFFTLTVLSSVGLPGLNGFVGEYLILLGSFSASPLWTCVGVTGVVLGAVYLLMATRRVLYGPIIHEENRRMADLGAREVGLMLPLFLFVVWIGVQPDAFLGKADATLEALQERIEDVRGARETSRRAIEEALPAAEVAR